MALSPRPDGQADFETAHCRILTALIAEAQYAPVKIEPHGVRSGSAARALPSNPATTRSSRVPVARRPLRPIR